MTSLLESFLEYIRPEEWHTFTEDDWKRWTDSEVSRIISEVNQAYESHPKPRDFRQAKGFEEGFSVIFKALKKALEEETK